MTEPESLSYGLCLGHAGIAISLAEAMHEELRPGDVETAEETFDRRVQVGCGLRIVEEAGKCVARCTRLDNGTCGLLQREDGPERVIEKLRGGQVTLTT